MAAATRCFGQGDALLEQYHEIPETVTLARELKRRGFRFVGPTTLYALMQACGPVNGHLRDCPARSRVQEARRLAGLS